MSGIRELIGLHFFMNTDKKITIERLLQNKRQIPREKLQLIKDLLEEQSIIDPSVFEEKISGNDGGKL